MCILQTKGPKAQTVLEPGGARLELRPSNLVHLGLCLLRRLGVIGKQGPYFVLSEFCFQNNRDKFQSAKSVMVNKVTLSFRDLSLFPPCDGNGLNQLVPPLLSPLPTRPRTGVVVLRGWGRTVGHSYVLLIPI